MNQELEKHRIRVGQFGSSEIDGFNGMFMIPIYGEIFRVIASDGLGWQHVSVSKHNRPNRVPNHDHLCKIKELFWGRDVWCCHFYPPQSQYVNNHPGCLHLWRPTREFLPTPPAELVGCKGKSPEDIKGMSRQAVMADYMRANSK